MLFFCIHEIYDIFHYLHNSLWRKENDEGGEKIYCNPFASIEEYASGDVRIWTKIFKSDGIKKCKQMSMELTQNGDEAYTKRYWKKAMNYYNQALSLTERHTLAESILYLKRGQSFSQLGMREKALKDYDFASSERPGDNQFLEFVNILRARNKSVNRKRKLDYADSCQLKMKFVVNEKFPCMVNAFEIQKSETFGRYILSTKDIGIGNMVFEAKPFASVALPSKQAHCSVCMETDMNFIPCEECNVLFCDSCFNLNSTHDFVCGMNFDGINDITLKLIIESVLVAINMFPSPEKMIAFVENICGERFAQIPKSSIDFQSKYEVFLGLVQSEKNVQCLLNAYLAFNYLTGVPKLNDWLNTKRKKRFFMNLILHHAAVIPRNMFEDTFNNIECGQIFDVLSLFNHSCSPQLAFTNEKGSVSQLMARFPIKQGEQVFIDYLGGAIANEHERRKTYLKAAWDFDCKCGICTR